MLTVRERRDAVKPEPRRPAPHRDVTMLQPKPKRFVAALQSAEQEDRGQAQRYRDDGCAEIGLVLVLMQGHPRTGLVAIDQACIRKKSVEACPIRRLRGKFAK